MLWVPVYTLFQPNLLSFLKIQSIIHTMQCIYWFFTHYAVHILIFCERESDKEKLRGWGAERHKDKSKLVQTWSWPPHLLLSFFCRWLLKIFTFTNPHKKKKRKEIIHLATWKPKSAPKQSFKPPPTCQPASWTWQRNYWQPAHLAACWW
jgi:hypothetical protein